MFKETTGAFDWLINNNSSGCPVLKLPHILYTNMSTTSALYSQTVTDRLPHLNTQNMSPVLLPRLKSSTECINKGYSLQTPTRKRFTF